MQKNCLLTARTYLLKNIIPSKLYTASSIMIRSLIGKKVSDAYNILSNYKNMINEEEYDSFEYNSISCVCFNNDCTDYKPVITL